jgi:hypothetical protein
VSVAYVEHSMDSSKLQGHGISHLGTSYVVLVLRQRMRIRAFLC